MRTDRHAGGRRVQELEPRLARGGATTYPCEAARPVQAASDDKQSAGCRSTLDVYGECRGRSESERFISLVAPGPSGRWACRVDVCRTLDRRVLLVPALSDWCLPVLQLHLIQPLART